MTRIRECRALTELVNGSLSGIEVKARLRTPAAYRSAARSYVELAKKLRTIRVSQATGKSVLDEYVALFETVAPATEVYALALETRDSRRIDEAERGLDRFRHQERSLVARMDAYCHAP